MLPEAQVPQFFRVHLWDQAPRRQRPRSVPQAGGATRAGGSARRGSSPGPWLTAQFTVATLQDWHRQGADPVGKLSLLSAYLGHADPAYTYWYLQACPELLGLAAERLERWEAGRR